MLKDGGLLIIREVRGRKAARGEEGRRLASETRQAPSKDILVWQEEREVERRGMKVPESRVSL